MYFALFHHGYFPVQGFPKILKAMAKRITIVPIAVHKTVFPEKSSKMPDAYMAITIKIIAKFIRTDFIKLSPHSFLLLYNTIKNLKLMLQFFDFLLFEFAPFYKI